MGVAFRCILIAGVLAVVIGGPFLESRAEYAHHKRFREVDPGILYRCGQLTAEGFRDAAARTRCRLIVNCQDEYPDPALWQTFLNRHPINETVVCRELGIPYVHLVPDLCSNRTDPTARPRVIDEFLALMDNPANRPVLLHCKAGLHRTGVLVAVYRMEYDGWDPLAAIEELKANGFGDVACTAANDYIQQYVLNYKPRSQKSEVRSQRAEAGNRLNAPDR